MTLQVIVLLFTFLFSFISILYGSNYFIIFDICMISLEGHMHFYMYFKVSAIYQNLPRYIDLFQMMKEYKHLIDQINTTVHLMLILNTLVW